MPIKQTLTSFLSLVLLACGGESPESVAFGAEASECASPENEGFRVASLDFPGVVGDATVGDFNEDGFPDLLSGLLIYLSDGSGGLQNWREACPGEPGDVCNMPGILKGGAMIGDIDEDGHLDALVETRNDGEADAVTWAFLRGAGDGTLAVGSITPTQPAVTDAALGDWNGDGHLDLVVSAGDSTTCREVALAAYQNAPFCERFSDQEQCSGDLRCRALDRADGKCVPAGCPNLTVYQGNGHGGFAALKTIPTKGALQPIALADVNGDGRLDMATGGYVVTQLDDGLIVINNSDGSVSTVPSGIAGGAHVEPAVADVNHDCCRAA